MSKLLCLCIGVNQCQHRKLEQAILKGYITHDEMAARDLSVNDAIIEIESYYGDDCLSVKIPVGASK